MNPFLIVRRIHGREYFHAIFPHIFPVLIMMDDDTYYNMQLFVQAFKSIDNSVSLAIAGCRVRSPARIINYTFPFGGYGFIVSRGWLEKMTKPILCPRDTKYCHLIRRTNHIGERKVFQNGMTLADLSYAYSIHQPFDQYRNWTTGFCLHSDWCVLCISIVHGNCRPFTNLNFLFFVKGCMGT